MSQWIKKDDLVVVIKGNDRGRQGKVLEKLKDKVIVQGINLRKRHVKKSQKLQTSQIIEKEMPIPLCNVSLCSTDGQKIRPKIRITDSGARELIYYDKSKKPILIRTIKH